MEVPIIKDLRNSGALYRVCGILRCISKHAADQEEQDAIARLTGDPERVAGHTVGAYARAALNILTGRSIDPSDDEALKLARILPVRVSSFVAR